MLPRRLLKSWRSGRKDAEAFELLPAESLLLRSFEVRGVDAGPTIR
jgi:hypothetical protein